MGDDAMADIRERFKARATEPGATEEMSGSRRVNVERVSAGRWRGYGRDADHQPEDDWPAWVALAEDILGVTRLEVAALLDRCDKLEESADMACITPADDCQCAGCLTARDHYAAEKNGAAQ